MQATINSHVIPLWAVGEQRPPERERRKDPGARHRHAQAKAGTPSLINVIERQPEIPPAPPRLVSLW